MMLTKAVHLDVFYYDQFIMIFLENGPIDDIPKIFFVSFGEEHERFRISLRCPMQAFSVWIFSNTFEDSSDRT